MKRSLTFQVRGEIAADQAGSSNRKTPAEERLRRRRFPRTADRNWRSDAEPDRDSKTGVSAGYRFFGGVTASTGTVAARRHAGAHTPLIECKKHSCQH